MKEKQFKRCEGCEWDDCAELGSCGHSTEEEPVIVLRFPPGLIKMLRSVTTLSILRACCHWAVGFMLCWVYGRYIQHQMGYDSWFPLVLVLLVTLCLVQAGLGVYLNKAMCKADENDHGK